MYKKKSKITFAHILLIIVCNGILSSCSTLKRINDNDFLLQKTSIYEDGKKNNSEILNNLLRQRPNSKLLNFPLRLHMYNLARPNIDSIITSRYDLKPKRKKRLIKWLSERQFNNYFNFRVNFNNWLKKMGEAPVILNESKINISKLKLTNYFKDKGWLNAKVDTLITKKKQKAEVKYFISKGAPYFLGQIKTKIATPSIDSLYQHKLKHESLIVQGEQYDVVNLTNERERLATEIRNNGYYHFSQDYILFDIDTIGTKKSAKVEVFIENKIEKDIYGVNTRVPFKRYTVKEVNIYPDYIYKNLNRPIKDAIPYNGYNLYSYETFKYNPKAITDAVFITKNSYFSDRDRMLTYRHLSELETFKYPSIVYVENKEDTTLTVNIYLKPRKKYDLTFDFDVSQNYIQAFGFSFSSGLEIRNVFKGAEILTVSAIGAIGASKDVTNTKDQFFDINEFGADVKLTLPRFLFPLKTDKIIPKKMSPRTQINFTATSQRNVGLDRQTFQGAYNYKWRPSKQVTNSLDVFNTQLIKNLNASNYFGVYQNSFNVLYNIAERVNYNSEDLETSFNPDQFISDITNGIYTENVTNQDVTDVNDIAQRKQRITEDNVIVSSNFLYVKDKRDNLFDTNFSVIKFRVELAGNLLSASSGLFNYTKDSNQNYQVFGVTFSQYAKGEIDYIKHWGFGYKNVLAFRSYIGVAIPFGNSSNIPFSKSFFAGGPNDNRAWAAYGLGPGSSKNTNEFNEANFKLAFNLEQRFNLFGSVDGALFIDAGNIWNVLDDNEDQTAIFKDIKDLKNIAVGSGFGIRYDFNFFVLRGDIGFKTYDPSYNPSDRWFKNYNFSNAAFNIGINYPF